MEALAYLSAQQQGKVTPASTPQGTITTNKILYDEYKFISPFKRSMPDGWKASEEAIVFAQKIGVHLSENETCVRGFRKRVHRTSLNEVTRNPVDLTSCHLDLATTIDV